MTEILGGVARGPLPSMPVARVPEVDWPMVRGVLRDVRRRLDGGTTPAVSEELQALIDACLRQVEG